MGFKFILFENDKGINNVAMIKINSAATVLVLALLAVQLPSSYCQDWWSV